ncbi:MAG TPA: DUF5985 family protein [Candidatus Polarisedimenticolia bacterium]|nr:DUF5985 family protein [Candidatus Polarisedimenticolia bacterium]
MAETVYMLCALTSIACAWLLLRTWSRRRVRLLLWTGLCFIGLAANNVILFVDLVMVPETDFGPLRSVVALLALGVLLYGLVWESV